MAAESRSFFAGIDQAEVPLGEGRIKVPIFYYDASSVTAIFPASARKLKKILPDPAYHPLTIAPGIGTVAVTAFAYRETDIGPYNELSIAIPMAYKTRSLLPGRDLVRQFRRGEFHAYVRHLPVTTRIALDAGRVFFNYPKFLAAIRFTETHASVAAALEVDGENILTLTGKKIPLGGPRVLRYVTYPYRDGVPHEAPVLINAQMMAFTLMRSAATLDLGATHPMSLELKGLLLSRRPIQYHYIPRFQAVLYGPSRLN